MRQIRVFRNGAFCLEESSTHRRLAVGEVNEFGQIRVTYCAPEFPEASALSEFRMFLGKRR